MYIQKCVASFAAIENTTYSYIFVLKVYTCTCGAHIENRCNTENGTIIAHLFRFCLR